MNKEYSNIYIITNIINNKQYIGQTIKSIKQRFEQHLRNSENSDINRMPIHKAIKKYGKDNFKVELLERVPLEEANTKEKYYINKYNTYHDGYNATLGGQEHFHKLDIDDEIILKEYLRLRSTRKVGKLLNIDHSTVSNRLKAMGQEIFPQSINAYTINVYDVNNKLVNSSYTKRECAKWFIENNIPKSKNIDSVRRAIVNTENYYGYRIEIIDEDIVCS